MTLLAMALSLLAACTGAQQQTGSQGNAPGAAGDWQARWDKTVAEAKKEGTVSIYVTAYLGAELRSALGKAFKDKYGIELAFSPFSGSDMAAKVKAEEGAGMFLADVYMDGNTPFVLTFKPDKLLGNMDQMLILPEVLDDKAWDSGKLFEFDKDHLMINMLRVINRSVVYNTDMVKENEISSYKDFLKPQFKDKVTITDPTQSGPGGWFANHLVDVFGFDGAMQYLDDLLSKQNAVIQRDARMHIETVARGKYAVALGGGTQYIADFMALGSPIAIKIPSEGDGGGASFGSLSIPTKQRHPNAAAVYINWLLTKEGQSLFAKGSGNPSRRLDASTEGVNPIFLPMPGEKVAWDTIEFKMRNAQVFQATKAIIDKAAK